MTTIITCYILLAAVYYRINQKLIAKVHAADIIFYRIPNAQTMIMNNQEFDEEFREFYVIAEMHPLGTLVIYALYLIVYTFGLFKYLLIWWLHNLVFVITYLAYQKEWNLLEYDNDETFDDDDH